MNENFVSVYSCVICTFVSRHFSDLLSHYSVHSHDPNFQLTCGINACQATFRSIRVFKRHIKSKHNAFYRNNLFNKLQGHLDDTEDEIYVNLGNDANESDDNNQRQDLKQYVALQLLSLRETSKLQYSACPLILDLVGNILDKMNKRTLKEVYKILTTANCNDVLFNEIGRTILGEKQLLESILSQLSDEYKFNSYIRNTFSFVKPVEHVVGNLPDGRPDVVQYIPLLETIKSLLKHEDVFSQVMNQQQSQDGKMRDICDGSRFKQNQLFGRVQRAIQIMLYYDEFTAVNPIGHKAKHYKYGAFYFVIGNLGPKHRSKLHVMQLALLAHSKSIRANGLFTVMQPLIRDAMTLETEGVMIERSDGEFQFYGSIAAVIADNLAAHMLGGFMESFSGFRNCRFCTITRDEMLVSTNPQTAPERTIPGHKEQVNVVTEAGGLANTYGVKSDSPLNALHHFHIIGGLPPDIGHDLFESGVVCDVLEKIIHSFVRDGLFSLIFLNEQIEQFPYGSNDKSNKPTILATQLCRLKVKQNCMQIWCLLRLFPLLVGFAVEEGNSKWEVLLALMDMVENICAPITSDGDCAFMNDCIQKFVSLYTREFPETQFKPKLHYVLHYPQQTRKFGPLINVWTMRFEGKHNFFKEIVRRVKNRKNLCKTMAFRHQYHQCLWAESKSFLSEEGQYEHHHASTIQVTVLDDKIQDLLQPHVHGATDVFQCQSVRVNGHMYAPGCVMAEVEFHITNVKINGINQKSIISFSLDQAEVAISRHFDIPLGFHTQLYSDKYSDWVDISLNDPKLQGGGKLRVMSSPKADDDVNERGDNPQPTTAGQQEVPAILTKTPATCTNKTSVSTTNIQTSAWQSPYTLPAVLPRDAVDVLDKGGFPNQGSRSHLLDSIYNDVSVKYTLYPLSYQYNEIIDALFQRWSHLVTEDGLEGSSTRVLWRSRIRDKFINSRRRKDSNVACVQQRKRKPANVVLEEPSPSKMPLPVGEDDHSIQRHVQWMKQEARARKPDRSKISLLMKLTFSTRREMVTSGGATVKAILDEYPWLADEHEICAEYSRLTETNITDNVNSGLRKVAERIYYIVRNSSKVEDEVNALMRDVDTRTDETEKKYAVLATVILGLPGLLREEAKTFIARGCEVANTVPSFIAYDGSAEEAFIDIRSFHVLSEGQKVCSTDNIIDALKIYLAVFYVFDLQYPQGLSKTHLFMDKILLKINNKIIGKKTMKTKSFEKSVNSLISKLNAGT